MKVLQFFVSYTIDTGSFYNGIEFGVEDNEDVTIRYAVVLNEIKDSHNAKFPNFSITDVTEIKINVLTRLD